jgi:hypothetical protein
MEQYKIDFESMSWEEPACGVKFKAYEQNGKKLRFLLRILSNLGARTVISVIFLKGK